MSGGITIIGAGPGGCAAAADLSRQGRDVTLFNRTDARLDPLQRQGGIRLKDPDDRGLVPIHRFTTNIEQALAAAQILVVMVPTSSLEFYATIMAPHLHDDHRVLLAPGHTGGALCFTRVLRDEQKQLNVKVGEASSLPYICRMTAEGEVTVWSRATDLLFAALPARDTEELHAISQSLSFGFRPASSVLETSLNNANAIMHPPGMVMNAGWIEHTGGDFLIYSEGTTPSIGNVMEALDDERLTIASGLDVELESFVDDFYRAGGTTEQAWKSGEIFRVLAESEPNREIRAPSSLDHRYLDEDVGYGLVPMSVLGEIAGAETPTIDALIHLAGIARGKNYQESGLTAARLGIEGMDRAALQEYVTG